MALRSASSGLLALFNDLLYQSSVWVAGMLPKRLAVFYAFGVSEIVRVLRRGQTRILEEQITVLRRGVTARRAAALAKAVYRDYAGSCVDGLFESRLSRRRGISRTLRTMKTKGLLDLDEGLRRGKGVILLSFHAGSWDLGALRLAYLGYPVTVMRLGPKGDTFTARDPITARRSRWGCGEVSHAESLRKMRGILSQNGILGMLIDRRYGSRGVKVTLKGMEAEIAAGAATLAGATGAEVALAVCRRHGSEYRLEITRFGSFDRGASGEQAMRLLAMCADYLRKKSGMRWYLFLPVIGRKVA